MRNVFDKNFIENKETHFILSNIFPKIIPWKMWWNLRGNMASQCGAYALHAG
jgi:hypothetical protein